MRRGLSRFRRHQRKPSHLRTIGSSSMSPWRFGRRIGSIRFCHRDEASRNLQLRSIHRLEPMKLQLSRTHRVSTGRSFSRTHRILYTGSPRHRIRSGCLWGSSRLRERYHHELSTRTLYFPLKSASHAGYSHSSTRSYRFPDSKQRNKSGITPGRVCSWVNHSLTRS